ncbi:hypothetical protein WA158_006039 [Blastocystis sp. Blastoise]
MKYIIFLICLLVVHASLLRQTEFDHYLIIHSKNYSNLEYQYRLKVFSLNMRDIEYHNSKQLSWKEGANQFTDLTPDEFQAKFCGCLDRSHYLNMKKTIPYVYKGTLASTIDWRQQGAVSPVKDQGDCGSCWSFSVTGAVESAYYQKKNEMIEFSEQELIDCSKIAPYHNNGCQGGCTDHGMEYVTDNGLCSEKDYPYTAKDNECASDQCKKIVKVISTQQVSFGGEESLANMLNESVVSVILDGTAMQHYKSGIITECDDNVNHAVLAVGYGEENGIKYWIVKNSWGSDWGEDGYVRIQKDTEGMGKCSIAIFNILVDKIELL